MDIISEIYVLKWENYQEESFKVKDIIEKTLNVQDLKVKF